MASFSKEIEDMRLQTYDSVVSLYRLITELSNNLGLIKPTVKGEFQFRLGKITCVCESYDEFVENAYGAEDFHLVAINLIIRDGITIVISIHSIGGDRVSVQADSRAVLEKFFTELEMAQSVAQNPTNGVTQNIIDSVVINGDGNTVANKNSSVEIEVEPKESTVKNFWTGILQNITSNLLWYILTLTAGALVTYFAMK